MPRVTFLPDGQHRNMPAGARLLAAIQRAGRPIGLSCRGRGICVACRVRVQGSLAPVEPDEAALLVKIEEPGAWRIACLARLGEGDVRVHADYW